MTAISGYLALGALDNSGRFTELSGGSYARQAVTFASGGFDAAFFNTTPITFGSTSLVFFHYAVFDALTGGNLLLDFPVDVGLAFGPNLNLGIVPTFGAGALRFAASPLVGALQASTTTLFPAGSFLGKLPTLVFQPVNSGVALSVSGGVVRAA